MSAPGSNMSLPQATVVHAMVAQLISVPLYPFFLRSMAAAARRKAETPESITDPGKGAPP